MRLIAKAPPGQPSGPRISGSLADASSRSGEEQALPASCGSFACCVALSVVCQTGKFARNPETRPRTLMMPMSMNPASLTHGNTRSRLHTEVMDSDSDTPGRCSWQAMGTMVRHGDRIGDQ